MKLLAVLSLIIPKFLKNTSLPLCKNCAYYRVTNLSSDDFIKYSQFGEMDVITGEITYDYAKFVWLNENKYCTTETFFK